MDQTMGGHVFIVSSSYWLASIFETFWGCLIVAMGFVCERCTLLCVLWGNQGPLIVFSMDPLGGNLAIKFNGHSVAWCNLFTIRCCWCLHPSCIGSQCKVSLHLISELKSCTPSWMQPFHHFWHSCSDVSKNCDVGMLHNEEKLGTSHKQTNMAWKMDEMETQWWRWFYEAFA